MIVLDEGPGGSLVLEYGNTPYDEQSHIDMADFFVHMGEIKDVIIVASDKAITISLGCESDWPKARAFFAAKG